MTVLEQTPHRSKAALTAKDVIAASWTPTGLKLTDPELPFGVYEEIGQALGSIRDSTAWALGDWILFGEGVYGERYAQAVEATGRAKATLTMYARVALRVAPKRRRKQLSFYHHRLVARFDDPDLQDSWLRAAASEKWSVEEFRGKLDAIDLYGEQLTDDEQEPDTEPVVYRDRVIEVGLRIARQATRDGDYWRVPNELMLQLRAAAGLDQ
jgi:hypothetical protein